MIPMYLRINIRRKLVFILTLIFCTVSLAAVASRPKQKAAPAAPLVSNSPKTNIARGNRSAVALRGEEAISQLKQQGAYESLAEAMTTAISPLWQQQKQLTAADGRAHDNFGSSVAISGNTAIVGSRYGGSAYIFVRNGATWSLQQQLMENQDNFGVSVATNGDTTLVGAPGADLGGGTNDQGAVYVYVRNGLTWSLQQELTANAPSRYFGSSLAISGDTAIVGTQNGGAYIFARTGNTWAQQNLTANLSEGSAWGYSVAISGDTAIVGATDLADFVPPDDYNESVIVFVRNGGTWAEQQKLSADDHELYDRFGSIAISGDTVIIGYVNGCGCAATPPDLTRRGAYVFVRSSGTWSQQQKLDTIPAPSSVAISGENAVVGFSDGGGNDEGVAYLYTRTNGTWFYQQTLTGAYLAAGDAFGFSVAISGGTAIVGAPYDDVGTNPNQGSAYVFVGSPDTDGDGLPDDWEQNGVRIDDVFIDLPAMGADPMHKDIFVHADWMALSPAGAVLKPDPTAIKMVMDAFADAPVENPDDEDGINLHVDLGPDSIMDPVTDVTWGFYSRAGETAFQEELGTLSSTDGNYEWYAFDAVKTERFDNTKRKAIFHYALFCNTFAGTPYSGLSRGNAAADFLISLGPERTAVSPGGTMEHVPAGGTVMQQAGTFMHELGHNLGLRHGGGDNIGFKPNYLSVMNYYFQFPGLLDLNGERTLDYSRAEIPALVQTNLDESVGIRDPGDHLTLWNGPSRPDNPPGSNRCLANENNYYKVFSPGIGLDWNCNGALTLEPVSIRLVSDPAPPLPPVPDTLTGFDDWANLRYDGGGRIGDLGFGGTGLATTPIDELPVEQILSAIPPALLTDELAAPHDVVTVTPRAGAAPLSVNFNGSASTAVTGTIAAWSWKFGDGAIGSGPTVQHTYTVTGTYFASLTVTDDSGRVNLVPLLHRVTVGDAPSPTPTPTPGVPNLTPYQPSGWADKLVVSNRTGTNTDSSPLLARDSLYVDFAIINNGNGATATPFQAKIYVDGVEVQSFTVNPPLNASAYTFLEDFPLGSLSAGQHAIKIVADANGEIAEGDETDNEYTKSISVSPSTAAFVSRQNGDWGNPCTWNVPDGNGNCGSSYPGASDSVEINHVVANGQSACQSLKLSGSLSGVPMSISGDLQILGGVVNADLTVGGNTSVIGGTLSKSLRTRDITVNGTLAGPGSIQVDRAGAGNTVVFTNNGTVTVRGVTFGLGGETFNYAIAGTGTFNISQYSTVSPGNSLDVTAIAQMNGGLTVHPGARLIVSGALTFGSGTLVIAAANGITGTVVTNGSLNFTGTSSISNNGTLNIPGGRTLNFNGDRFDTGGGGGVTIGTGTIRFAPSGGSSLFGVNGLIEPGVTIAAGTIKYSGSSSEIKGPIVIDAGATFAMWGSTLYAHGDVTNNGAITNFDPSYACVLNFIGNGKTFTNNGSIGDINFIQFIDPTLGQNGPHAQFIAGTGSWAVQNIQIGGTGGYPDYLPVVTVVTAMNDANLNGRLQIATGSGLNIGSHTLTLNNPKNFTGKVTGTGLVKIYSTSSETLIAGVAIDPALEIASGPVKGVFSVNGPLTIDNGATLSLVDSSQSRANGNFTNNGTLIGFKDPNNPYNPPPSSLYFNGGTFTNNGNVTGDVNVDFYILSENLPPLTQNLAGTGSWANSRLFIGTNSTTTLANDFTYNGGNLYVEGRLNTSVFTLALPCTTLWQGAGDVIGNIRRTNLVACPGAAVAYGSPFSTIQFTSGTPPTEIAFNIALSSPAGFAGAVGRTYLITPSGGSGYSATLRLHYLDAELNGNAESTLQLWRNNGSNWLSQGATTRNPTDNWVEYAGVTQFSPWAISGPPTPPVAPSALTATAVSTTQINLAWADNSGNETGFKIERCGKGKNCANAVEIAQVAANTRNYSNTGLIKGTSYSYRVRAFNAVGNSAYTNIATASTPRR
jgi:hypothetical protein